VPIPEDTALTPFVLSRAEELGDKAALIDGSSGRALTYGRLVRDVKSIAAGLAKRGFGKGDTFAIYCPNLPEYATAFLGIAMAGGVNTTVNPLYTSDELAKQLLDSGAKYLLTVPMFLDKALKAAGKAGVEEVFVLGEAEAATPFTALLWENGEVPNVTINPKEDLAALPYSSGTTGLPKGVMLTHYNLIANICQNIGMGHCGPEDRLMGTLPFFHSYGLVVILLCGLRLGCTTISLPQFNLEIFLKVIQDYKVTYANLVPPIILALANHPVVSQYDLSSLKKITSGAAPLSEQIELKCAQRLGCVVLQGFGLTEASPVTHLPPKEPDRIKTGASGCCIPNTECKIAAVESGEECKVGQKGEICIRGPQVMKGYLNNPEASAATVDSQGWLHTGDIGYIDEEGYLYVVDRVKELIKYKGLQVAPAELEGLLLQHSAVADVAVVPSPDEEAGEVPKAFIVPSREVSAEEIQAFVAERVSPHKKIRRLEFIDEIPKSASGKILRRMLIDRDRKS
jgi:acyl-CoA synthetase (AMP-forming)/AMP-acid ligase II